MLSIKQFTIVIMTVIFSAGFALAQDSNQSNTESKWLLTDVDRKLTDEYDQILRTALNSGAAEEDVRPGIQYQIDGTARCSVQRSYLANKAKDADRKQKLKDESRLFANHYLYLAVALERNGIAKTSALVKELSDGQDILLNQIDQIYTASANSDDDQMSDEVFALYQACNSLLTDINLRQFSAERE